MIVQYRANIMNNTGTLASVIPISQVATLTPRKWHQLQ